VVTEVVLLVVIPLGLVMVIAMTVTMFAVVTGMVETAVEKLQMISSMHIVTRVNV
jgi:hypothetical protein